MPLVQVTPNSCWTEIAMDGTIMLSLQTLLSPGNGKDQLPTYLGAGRTTRFYTLEPRMVKPFYEAQLPGGKLVSSIMLKNSGGHP